MADCKRIVDDLFGFFPEVHRDLKKFSKDDGSPVTKFDLELSKRLDECLSGHAHVLCEEGSHQLKFPCFVIDPIDGTKELVKGIPEFAVSIAYLNSENVSDPLSWGWIYQPLLRLEFSSRHHFDWNNNRHHLEQRQILFVSRTELESGLWKGIENARPMGSIALKLGYLSAGVCSEVQSKKPKNIWDIAAGVIVLNQAGGKSLIDNKPLVKFDQVRFSPKLFRFCF